MELQYYAVVFLNKRERLIIMCQQAQNEREAIEKVLAKNEEGVYWAIPPRATLIEEGKCIYHADND